MIKPLRKIHVHVWALLAVLIPVGIILAWMAVPEKVTDDLNRVNQFVQPLPQQVITNDSIIASVDRDKYKINILFPTDLVGEIRWYYNLKLQFINKKELTIPSLLIYRIIDHGENIDNQELVGRIE